MPTVKRLRARVTGIVLAAVVSGRLASAPRPFFCAASGAARPKQGCRCGATACRLPPFPPPLLRHGTDGASGTGTTDDLRSSIARRGCRTPPHRNARRSPSVVALLAQPLMRVLPPPP